MSFATPLTMNEFFLFFVQNKSYLASPNSSYSSFRILIISTAALLTDVPGPKIAATPAL